MNTLDDLFFIILIFLNLNKILFYHESEFKELDIKRAQNYHSSNFH